MIIYLLLFIILIIFSLISPFLSKKGNRLCSYLVLIVFIFFISFRGNVGIDTITYKKAFFVIHRLDTLKELYDYYSILGFEFGFYWLTKGISLVTSNFNIYMLIVNLISFTFLFKAIEKKSNNVLLSVCLYFVLFFLNYMNIWRQLIAMNIALYSFTFLKTNFKKYIIYLIIASSIHLSVLFLLSLIILKKYQFKRQHLIIVTILVITTYIFADKIFFYIVNNISIFSKFSLYEIGKTSNFIPVIISSTILILALYIYLLNFKDEEMKIYLLCQIICFTCILCSTQFFYIKRISTLFYIFIILWIPLLIKDKINMNRYFIIIAFILIQCVLAINTINDPNEKYIPYQIAFKADNSYIID